MNNIKVNFEGNEFIIPYRTYDRYLIPMPILKILPLKVRTYYYARYARHHNGYVREKFIVELIETKDTISIPYLVHLASEYVKEIADAILQRIEKVNTEEISTFIRNNSKYYESCKSRMITYWALYYRTKFPDKKDYSGYKIFKYLDKYK